MKLKLVSLNKFGDLLKGALKDNKFTAPFTNKNYPLNDWYDIFNVLQYDEAKCRACFKDLCDDDGKLYYKALEK